MPSDLNKSLQSFAKSLQRAQEKTLRDTGAVGVARHEAQIRRDAGGDLRLSGVNKAKGRPGGANVGARVKIVNRGKTSVGAEMVATGPMHLLSNPTAGRVIRSAYQSGRYRKSSKGRGGVKSQFIGPALPGQTFTGDRRAVLNIPGIGFRRYVRHPGTKGKDTWPRGQADALSAMDRFIAARTDAEAAKAFRESAQGGM